MGIYQPDIERKPWWKECLFLVAANRLGAQNVWPQNTLITDVDTRCSQCSHHPTMITKKSG